MKNIIGKSVIWPSATLENKHRKHSQNLFRISLYNKLAENFERFTNASLKTKLKAQSCVLLRKCFTFTRNNIRTKINAKLIKIMIH